MMMMSKDLERQHIEDLPVEKNPIARRKQATGRGFTCYPGVQSSGRLFLPDTYMYLFCCHPTAIDVRTYIYSHQPRAIGYRPHHPDIRAGLFLHQEVSEGGRSEGAS